MRNPRYASPRKLAHQIRCCLLALGVATTRQLCVWAYGELNSAAWYVVGGPLGLLDQDFTSGGGVETVPPPSQSPITTLNRPMTLGAIPRRHRVSCW